MHTSTLGSRISCHVLSRQMTLTCKQARVNHHHHHHHHRRALSRAPGYVGHTSSTHHHIQIEGYQTLLDAFQLRSMRQQTYNAARYRLQGTLPLDERLLTNSSNTLPDTPGGPTDPYAGSIWNVIWNVRKQQLLSLDEISLQEEWGVRLG